MKINDAIAVFSTLCKLAEGSEAKPLVKKAFDTRRIDQTLDRNPRRNLQNYHRSEPHLDVKTAEKVQLFFKVKAVADDLKKELETDPEFLDSYLRTLCGTLDQVLRVEQKDMDYAPNQFNYLKDMLYVRYRLSEEDINRMSHLEIRSTLLSKDEKLLYSSIHNNYTTLSKKSDVPKTVDFKDSLIEKLFGEVKASKDNKEVERSVTITIKDKIVDQNLIKEAGKKNAR